MEQLTPLTREEEILNTLLSAAGGGSVEDLTPETRKEQWYQNALDAINGNELTYDLAAEWRREQWYTKLIEALQEGGGGSVPEYEGLYSVTPSETAQTLDCDGKKMTDDVTVGAISSTYIGSGVTQKAAATYTPTTSDQTIAANQYLAGAQTVKGDANLVAGNIKKDVQMFGVTGTYEGGGGGGGTEPKIDVISVADGLTNPTISQSEIYAFQLLGDFTSSITDHRISYILFDDVAQGVVYHPALTCAAITQTANGYTAKFSAGGRLVDSNEAIGYEAVLSYSSAQDKITVDSITYQYLQVRGYVWHTENIKSVVSSVKLVSIKLD